MQYSGASLQLLSRRICLQGRRLRERCFDLWVGKNWRRKWQSTPEFLPGKSGGQRSLVGRGVAKSDTTERLCTFAVFKDFTCNIPCFLLFSCSIVSDSVTPWTAARQASLSFTSSRSLLKLMSIELVMPPSVASFSSCCQSFQALKPVKKKKGRTRIIFILQFNQVRFG